MYETELPKLLTLSLHLDFQGQKLKLYSCSYFVNIFKSCIKINVTARISEHNSMPAFKMYFWFVLMYSIMMCITCKRSDVQVNLLIWDLRNDCFHKWMKTSTGYTCHFHCFIVTLDPWLHKVILFIELSSWKFAVATAYRRCGGDKKITYNHKSGAYHLSRNPFSLM